MNIVQAQKFLWPSGGDSSYAIFLLELLKKHRQNVIPFTIKDSRNPSSEYDEFFVNSAYPREEKVSFLKKIQYAGQIFYSFEAKRKMQALLNKEHVDIVHLHNIYHQISPSILPVIKKKKIPIVMTLHDYKLICPNYTLFHHGGVHDEDSLGWYLSCVKNKCFKNSRWQSALVTAEMIFHHKIMKYYEKDVDLLLAPSLFIRNKFIEHGWKKEKIIHLPYTINFNSFEYIAEDKGYVAYVGRLVEEKGLQVLLEAAKITPEIKYKIAGTGPLMQDLLTIIKKEKLNNVQLVGFKIGRDLREFLGGARLVVVPSIWYEVYGIVILEAKAMGKPVVGSRIGGIPEILPKELLVEPGNAEDLARTVSFWYTETEERRKEMGRRMREEVKKENDPEDHVKKILEIYKQLI